jgi:hypothetical protein
MRIAWKKARFHMTNFLKRGWSCWIAPRKLDQVLCCCQNGSRGLNVTAVSWLLRLDDKTAPARSERGDLDA